MPSPNSSAHQAAREAAGRRLWAWLLAPDDEEASKNANAPAVPSRGGAETDGERHAQACSKPQ
jgi:hypothetical protein